MVEAEAAAVVVIVVVVEETQTRLLQPKTTKMGDNLSRGIRVTSILTFPRGCGLDVLCILNGVAKVTFVQNLRLVRGKM